MVGIAALGTAVGAASKGYMEGERHRSEMEDSELRRELAGTQLRKAKREEDYDKELGSLYSDIQAGQQQPAQGIANPAATPNGSAALNPDLNKDQATSIPSGPATAVGGASGPIAVPTRGGIAAPGSAAPAQGSGLGNMGNMEAVIQRRQALDLKYGKINEVQALQMMKNYKQLQQEGVIDGMNYFQQTGDRDGAIQRINSTGAMKLDPNARFAIQEKEIAPGVKIPNVVVTSPDGQHSFNQYDSMYSALSPKEAFSMKHEVGFKLADLTLKQQAEENLKDYRTRMANARDKEVAGAIKYHEAQIKESGARLEALTDDKKAKLRAETSQKAFDNILTAEGVSKEMTMEKLEQLPKAKQAEYRQRLDRAFTAHAMWEMNTDAKGQATVSPSEAQTITRNLSKMPADSIKYDKFGKGYVKYGDKDVYIPGVSKMPEQEKPAQQAAAAPQAGVKTPAAPVAATVDDSAPGGIAGPSALSSKPPVQEAGVAPQRVNGESTTAFRQRVMAWDQQRQEHAAQQEAIARESERQRLLAARGGSAGMGRPLIDGMPADRPDPMKVEVDNPITNAARWFATPHGPEITYRPDPNAPSIYANPAEWAAYNANKRQAGGIRRPQAETTR